MAVDKCLLAIDAQKKRVSELESGAFGQGTDWAKKQRATCKDLVPLVRQVAYAVNTGAEVRRQSRNVVANRLHDVSDAEMGLVTSAWDVCKSAIDAWHGETCRVVAAIDVVGAENAFAHMALKPTVLDALKARGVSHRVESESAWPGPARPDPAGPARPAWPGLFGPAQAHRRRREASVNGQSIKFGSIE